MAPAPQVTYYVIMTKQSPDGGFALRPISRLLKQEEEVVEEMLQTTTYMVVARYAKKANAEGLRGQLHALGVEVLILSDSDIKSHLFMWAKTANSGQGGMAFMDFTEKPLFCPWADIAGVMLMQVKCENGSEATLIDVHRVSTTIVPRLDAAHFDFSALLEQKGATIEDFLAEIESRGKIDVNRQYNDDHREALQKAAKDFASAPGTFQPGDDALTSPYDRRDLLAANLFSLVKAAERVPSDG